MLSLGLAWLYLTQINKTSKTITERTQLTVVLSGALGREPWHELSVQPSSCALCRALPSLGYCTASDSCKNLSFFFPRAFGTGDF